VGKLVALCVAALLCLNLSAAPTAETALDRHVMIVAEQLRCLVCQNQTIADSHADLAVDLRRQVREQIVQGKSDQQILDFMVQRYGDFVLYRPPLRASTWLLWFGPFVVLAGGLVFLLRRLRQRETVVS
jgi:cytochrome c-type biogenesis protein CcmH